MVTEGYVDNSMVSKLQASNQILQHNVRVPSKSNHNIEDLDIAHKNVHISNTSAAGVSISIYLIIYYYLIEEVSTTHTTNPQYQKYKTIIINIQIFYTNQPTEARKFPTCFSSAERRENSCGKITTSAPAFVRIFLN